MGYKKLHIIANDYPNTGSMDTIFFKDEINLLSKKFDQIVIYPTSKADKIKIKSQKKIKINNSLNKRIYHPIYLILYLIKIIFFKDLWLEILKIKNSNIIKKIKIILLSRYKSEIIYNFFKKQNVKKDYFYSFWSNYVLIAFYFLKKKKIISKCFARTNGSDLKGYINKDSFVEYKKFKFSKLDLILTLNNEQNKILTSQKLIDKKKIYKNYLGINHKKLILNYNKKIIKFVSCGRLIDLKNNHKIFEFIKNFSKNNPSLKIYFYCIGSGPEKKSLINYAKNNFDKNINFSLINYVNSLTNFLKEKKINFFLNFSDSEGMSFAVMEALSCSIPIICSNIPGNTEIINKQNGYVLNKLNEKNYSLVSKIIKSDFFNKKKYFDKRKKSYQVIIKKISRRKNQLALNKILDDFIK